MPLDDDLRRITDRARKSLASVMDFHVHSRAVWRSFQLFVAQGHRTTSDSLVVGKPINQDELVSLALEYDKAYLLRFTFRQFVSIFEAFLFDFLHRLFRHNPWQFARTQLDFEAVLRAADRDEVIANVIGRQLNDLRYGNVRDWFAVMNKCVALGCPADDEIDSLAEVKATRDILEHNEGVVNEVYVRKAGKKARHPVGDHVELDDDYHLACWRLLDKIAADLADASAEKMGA